MPCKALTRFAPSFLLAAAGWLFSLQANAQDTLQVCDGCSSSYINTIVWHDTNAEQAPFWGYKYYVNRQTGEVLKFLTSKENDAPSITCTPATPWGCQDIITIVPETPEPEFHDYGIKAQQAWGSVIEISPGPGIPNNAYEFVQFPQAREVTMAQAHTKAAVLTVVTQSLRGLVDKYILSLPPKVVSVTLKLPDGSRVIAIMDPVTERFAHEPNTVRDRAGNFVPESPAKIAGGLGQTTYYDFQNNPDDRFRFINWVSSLGASVNGSSGHVRQRCTESADSSETGVNVTITCTSY
ncbi:hypothetical protein [Stenotrophomonas sp. SY1]|uniref:hypothetical protein n=1 Tax=Stenotrophomonas sp. SY1 TaxID=477235 RepID=UPI001E4AE1C5|nr:hypothetical protein [Stenotrophomonas sp. SY1]MCD9085600.1 hypothetical protein [Stenotrophomonas sp. SY1]